MIVRVKIVRKGGGSVLRKWALHRCGEGVTLTNLKDVLFSGDSTNILFPAIEPFYLQCRTTLARCGMSISDMVATPMDFSVSDVHTGKKYYEN